MNEQLSIFDELPDAGYTSVSEYLIVISPSEEIREKVKFFKNEIHTLVNLSNENRFATAHITLFELLNPKIREEDFILWIKNGLKNVKPFSVQIEDYGVFMHGETKRTLYLKVLDQESIKQLYTLLRSNAKFKISKKSLTPHLTLVKSISVSELQEVLHSKLDLSYQNEFECKSLLILKRQILGNKKGSFELVSEVFFGEENQ